MKKLVIALVVCFGLTSPAFAQDKKKRVMDFEADTIDGDLIRPEGDTLSVNDIASHTSLIKIRLDFIKEILKAAENL